MDRRSHVRSNQNFCLQSQRFSRTEVRVATDAAETLHLFNGSSNQICFQLLSHPQASSSASLKHLPTLPHVTVPSPQFLTWQFPPLRVPSPPFSIVFKCKEHVAVCMELNCTYKCTWSFFFWLSCVDIMRVMKYLLAYNKHWHTRWWLSLTVQVSVVVTFCLLTEHNV